MTGLEYKKVTEDYKWFAESVGKGVRTIALGTIGAIWAVMSAERVILEDTALFGCSTALLVKLAFVFASAALLFDLLQYIVTLWMYYIGLEKWEKRKQENGELQDEDFSFAYDREHLGAFGVFLYWSNTAFVPSKLILAFLAGATFVCLAFAVSIGST